ncbi:MAG: fibro-slime domain-containing protein [Myxococcales bacterium]
MRSWPLLTALWFVACGARTGLEGAEACGEAGQTRSCATLCGAGTQTCDGSFWQACVNPTVTRSCTNDCGAGVETCTSEGWQSCVVPVVQRECSSACGTGHETCSGGKWNVCDAPLPKPPVLHAVIRDFHRTQSDFELPVQGDQTDRGMVQTQLGADGTPVYAGNPTTKTTPSGKAGFDVWYHDTPGVNVSVSRDLQLSEVSGSPGLYAYTGKPFFPIDNQLFGNEGLPHNYHFTLATHTSFVYRGAEIFSFSGDDDVWVFIANKLAIDLGGLHQIQTKQVNLDEIAPTFGLFVGQEYPIDLFFAERHTVDSDFIVKTTIADVGSCQ